MMLRKKIITSVVFLSVLIILLIILVISPLFLEIKEISRDFPVQKQNLMVLEKKLEDLQEFKRNLPEISPNLEKINRLFIDPEVPIDFRLFLENAAQDSGVFLEISLASSPQIPDTDPWPSTSFNLTSAGSFSSFCIFLERLQSGPYLIEFQGLNITKLTEAELNFSELGQLSSDGIKANVLIKAYTEQ